MKIIKIMTVFGTRPEIIKMAPIIELLKSDERFKSFNVSTGQHRTILDQMLKAYNIVPDFDLDVLEANQSTSQIVSKVINKMEKVLTANKPDIVLVQGDTSSAFAAAFTAFSLLIKVGHVEAGLRTYNKFSPFPEETNRKFISLVSDIHFAPNINNKNNLIKEGIKDTDIHVTGNTIVDSMKNSIKDDYVFENEILKKIIDNNEKFIIVTAHRRENIGSGINNICKALKEISKK